MLGNWKQAERPRLLTGTVKIAAVILAVSFLAARWLSAGPLDRIASHGAGFEDPVTTGSIGRAADQTRLDPCAAPRPR